MLEQLRAQGYAVSYREFDGLHMMRRADVEEAFALIAAQRWDESAPRLRTRAMYRPPA